MPVTPGKKLPDGSINTLHVDTAGFIWSGGENGILLFTGGDPIPIGLPEGRDDTVLAFEEERKAEKLWFLTPGGIGWVGTKTGKGAFFPKPNSNEEIEFLTFASAGDDAFWISATDGLYRFNPGTKNFTAIEKDEKFRSISDIAISPQRQNELWLATGIHGLICYDSTTKEIKNYFHRDGPSGSPANCICLSDGNEVIFGGGNSITRLNRDSGEQTSVQIPLSRDLRYLNVTTLREDRVKNQIWIGTKSGRGVYRLELGDNSLLDFGDEIRLRGTRRGFSVNDIAIDTNRVLWVATERNGIALTPMPSFGVEEFAVWGEGKLQMYDGDYRFPASIKSNKTIAATRKGIIRIDLSEGEIEKLTGEPRHEANKIYGALRHSDGSIYAFFENAIQRLTPDENTWEKLAVLPTTEGVNYVKLAPQFDTNGKLWFCCRNQLHSFDPKTGTVNFHATIRHWADEITVIENLVWVATENYLYRWNIDSGAMELQLKTQLLMTHDLSPMTDDQGVFLATTQGLYSIRNDEDTIRLRGLPDTDVPSVCEGPTPDSLWIIKNERLKLFNLKYNRLESYPGDGEFNILRRKPTFLRRRPNGDLILGTWGRIFVVAEQDLITDFRQAQSPINLVETRTIRDGMVSANLVDFPQLSGMKKLQFTGSTQNAEFLFHIPDYRFPHETKFRYRIDDAKWMVSRNGYVEIPHLKNGIHTLQVEGTDSWRAPAANSMELQFEWHPPIWERWWFTLAAASLVLAVGYGFHLLRTRYIIRAKQKLESIHNELIRSESRYRNMFENSSDAILIVDATSRIVACNPQSLALTQRTPEEIVSLVDRPLSTYFSGDSEVDQWLQNARAGDHSPEKPFDVLTSSETLVPTLVSLSRVESIEGEEWQLRIRDISKQKEFEKKMRQAQKMEAVGTLAGGIAHDFNNLLSPIIVHSQIASDDIESRGERALPDVKEALDICGEAATKAAVLVKDLLHFARKADPGIATVDIAESTRNAIRLLKGSIPATIAIESDLPDAPAWTRCSPQRLEQALMNMGVNASHAIGINTGTIRFNLHQTGSGDHWELSIEDTGCGMKDETIQRIFDPFFTTKEVGKGTGLGLSMVHSFVEESAGSIEVESIPGEGTAIKMRFPVGEPSTEKSASALRQGLQTLEPAGEKELQRPSVMVIDDDPMVLKATSKILEKLGYTVDAFDSPIDALEAFEKSPCSIAAIVTDQMMPKMTGLDLARKIKDIRDSIPIILLTGFSDLLKESGESQQVVSAVRVKPLDYRDLDRTLIELTDISAASAVSLAS
ncbi:MAG: ATP-binding protein [Verrucomicrobiales bacterium]|nr:ATP-binding protein [Verrucomicrobiales bacterium]